MSNKFTVKQISNLVWQELKANKWQAINNTIAGLLIVGLEFLFVWLTKQTIDIATDVSHIFSFRIAIILLVSTLILQLIITAYRSWVNATLSIKASNKMQMDMFRHSLLTPWAELKAFHSGDIINRIEKDVNTIVSLVTDTLPSFIIVCAQFIGAFAFLYYMDSALALYIVIIIPFFVLIGKLYIKKMRKLSRKIREADSRLQAQYQEGIANRVVIKSIKGATKVMLLRVLKTQDKIIKLIHYRARFSVTSNFVMNLGFATAYLFTFIWGTYHLKQGLITYGALIAFVQLVGQIQRPARSLVKFIPDIISALTSGERILQIKTLNEEPVLQTDKEDEPTNRPKLLGIKVNNLTFAYKKGRNILDNFSYDFKPGSRITIMGPTGRGKTTLIRVMLSLLRPQEGKVEVYGDDYNRDIDIFTRRYFAYVPQGNTLFSGSIRSNLKLAAPEATDQQLNEALRMAKADFVFNLAEGLASQCGEHGVSLSEGQAQRLCIARALLVKAPILLLDEATSALDANTEAIVLENICTQLKDTTIICISHRKKVLDFCPEIVHLD